MSVGKVSSDSGHGSMGSHLLQANPAKLPMKKEVKMVVDENQQLNITSMNQESTLSNSKVESVNLFAHPSLMLDRRSCTEFERQNINVVSEFGEAIDGYIRMLETQFTTENCLKIHKITPTLRARMVDWMIEVLTNFRCEDQTFFLAVNLLDRFLKGSTEQQEVADLHLMGVTSMFIASKYEDISPLKMKMVYEKIAHKKLTIEKMKEMELKILKTINYKIPAPTVLEFLKVYQLQVLNIGHMGNTSLTKAQKQALPTNSDGEEGRKLLVQKMSMYLAKMSMHDYELSGRKPSLIAVGALYVALKICE